MADLTQHRVLIAVFGMPGCGACEDFIPMFTDLVEKRGRPFHVYVPGEPIPRGSIPILIYDVASPDQTIQDFANQYAISATPSVLVLRRGQGALKIEGSIDRNQAAHLLAIAHQANR